MNKNNIPYGYRALKPGEKILAGDQYYIDGDVRTHSVDTINYDPVVKAEFGINWRGIHLPHFRKLDIPSHFRLLGVGTPILSGDMYWCPVTEQWHRTNNPVGTGIVTNACEPRHYIRKIEADATPIPEGWRRLSEGTVIKHGDKFFCGGLGWMLSCNIDIPVIGSLIYIRQDELMKKHAVQKAQGVIPPQPSIFDSAEWKAQWAKADAQLQARQAQITAEIKKEVKEEVMRCAYDMSVPSIPAGFRQLDAGEIIRPFDTVWSRQWGWIQTKFAGKIVKGGVYIRKIELQNAPNFHVPIPEGWESVKTGEQVFTGYRSFTWVLGSKKYDWMDCSNSCGMSWVAKEGELYIRRK
jgi:hypothetical protein